MNIRLSHLLLFFRHIICKIEEFITFLIFKIGIKVESRLEDINADIIKEYYSMNYENDMNFSEVKTYMHSEYNGYKVDEIFNDCLVRDDNIRNLKEFRIVNYRFGLPLHMEVLNELKININKNKYELLYISLEMDSSNKLFTHEVYEFLEDRDIYVGLNIVFMYQSYIIYEDKSERSKYNFGYLLIVDKSKLFNIINNLNKKEIIIKYKLKIEVIKDELEFFKGDKLLNQYDLNKCNIYHFEHMVLAYKLDRDLINYYVLGNHLSRITPVYNISEVLNERFEIQNMVQNNMKVEMKVIKMEVNSYINYVYKNIYNEHLKQTFNYYVYINKSNKYLVLKKLENKMAHICSVGLLKLFEQKDSIVSNRISGYNYSNSYNNNNINNKIELDDVKSSLKNEINNNSSFRKERSDMLMEMRKLRKDIQNRNDLEIIIKEINESTKVNEQIWNSYNDIFKQDKENRFINSEILNSLDINEIEKNKILILEALKRYKRQDNEKFNKYIYSADNQLIDSCNVSTDYLKSCKDYKLSLVNKELERLNIEIVESNSFFYNRDDLRAKALYDHLCIKVKSKNDEIMMFPLTSDDYLYLNRLLKYNNIVMDKSIFETQITLFIKDKIKNNELYSSQFSSKLSYNANKDHLEKINNTFSEKIDELEIIDKLIINNEISRKCSVATNNLFKNVNNINKESIDNLVEGGKIYENVIKDKIENDLPVEQVNTIKKLIIDICTNIFNL